MSVNIDEIVERHLSEDKMKKKKEKSFVDKIRKPTAPPTIPHKDKNRYSRKSKHKMSEE